MNVMYVYDVPGGCLIVVALFLFVVSNDSSAQPLSEYALGGMIENAVGIQSGALPIYSDPGCGEFTPSSFQSWRARVGLSLPALFGDRLGFSASLGWERATARWTAAPGDAQRIVVGGELVDVQREFFLDATLQAIQLDLLAEYRLSDRIRLSGGPSFGYRYHIEFRQIDSLLGPGGTSFEDGLRSRVMPDGANRQARSAAFGGAIGIAFRVPIGRRVWLTPSGVLRGDILALTPSFSWRTFSAALGLGATYEFPATASPPPQVEPPPRVPAPPYLSASIDLYGMSDSGERLPMTKIRAFETFHRQRSPLIPALFFDSASASIPKRYINRSMNDRDFTIDSLAGASAMRIHQRLLDIVGRRMTSSPSALLMLTGSTSVGEHEGLGKERVAAVRSYLVRIWGVDSARIVTAVDGPSLGRSSEETEDGRAENRRVEFSTADSSILAPIVTTQIVRDFTPPVVQVDPSYESEAGLRRWSIIISQDENIVAQYSSEDQRGDQVSRFDWRIRQRRHDSSLAPVVAELTVEDSVGQIATARSHIPLVLEGRVHVVNENNEVVRDRERGTFMLVGFGYDSSEPALAFESEILEVVRNVRDGARIMITGFTDRIGDEGRNLDLSRRRAERTAAALRGMIERAGIRNVQISAQGAGVDRAQFDNDLPEGRMLARGARIVVERMLR